MGKLIIENDSGRTQRMLFLPEQDCEAHLFRSLCSQTVKFMLTPEGSLSRIESPARTQFIEFPD